MARHVPHEITLIAFTRDEDGLVSVWDIVETSFRNASYFTRHWLKNPEVHEVSAQSPAAAQFGNGKRRPFRPALTARPS